MSNDEQSVLDWPNEAEQAYAQAQADLAAEYEVTYDPNIITTDVGDIYYLETGNPSGEPVLLLHGVSTSAATWLPLVPAISDEFRVLIPDRPGRGLSVAPSYQGRDLRSFMVEYLLDLLDALDIDRPHVVGNSLGGQQAFLLAIDHDRVDRLCLVGGPGGISKEFSLLWRLLTVQGVNRVLFWLMNHGDPIENAKTSTEQFLVADASAVPEEFYAVMAASQALPGRAESLRSLQSEQGSWGRMHPLFDLRDEIVDIEVPTSFIWGTEDSFWEPSVGKPVAEQMPHAEFHVLDGHGHMPWLEPGDETAALLQEFLSS